MHLSWSGLLSVLLTTESVSAMPKAPWMRGARSRLAKSREWHTKRWTNSSACVDTPPANFKAPVDNVWQWSDAEAASVIQYLFSQAEFNLTTSDEAGERDNTLALVELMPPNKTDVLPYLDANAVAPARYAHAVLDMKSTDEPFYWDILVGPLPVSAATTWQPLEYPYTRKVQGKVRNLDADYGTFSEWVANVTSSIADITQALWGTTVTGSENDTIDVWGIDPYWQDDGRIITWQTFWNKPVDDFDAETLLPLGLYFQVDMTGRDPSQWKLEGWLYNDIYYPTTDAFRAAFYSPGFERLGANVEGDWCRTDQQGPVFPMDTASPPQAIAPGGSRFSVDAENKYIEWMGFTFYISFSRDTGMALHDVRYKGQRILYELSLQEALAHYAANDPMQSGTAYLDSYYGFGPYAFELIPGYDCPSYASFLNSSFYVDETTHTHINSICLFEFDADYPMSRHSTSSYVTATKNVYFTVRSVSTVGNYDYLFSYDFFTDGTIGVSVRASGYIQSAYYAKNEDYGYQIHDYLSGSMHDHVLNYKADFDIFGTANTMELTTFTPTTETYPWSPTKPRNTMKLSRSIVESESNGKLFWSPNGATQFRIINRSVTNAYNQPRGYRILPNDGAVHLTVLNSSNLVNAANWATHDLSVTRQKDSEPRSAHPYNSQDVADPPVDFNAFFRDDESLDQQDLVVWFNLGMHHLPHTGDLPTTVFTTAHSGVHFMPLNYFDGDVSRQTVNMVRIDYGGGEVSAVEEFGQQRPTCALDLTTQDPDLYGYTGDVVIRKFPYDPDEPYFETGSIV